MYVKKKKKVSTFNNCTGPDPSQNLLIGLLSVLLLTRFQRPWQFFPSYISESDLLEAPGRPEQISFPNLKSTAMGARINFFPFILKESPPSSIQEYVAS